MQRDSSYRAALLVAAAVALAGCDAGPDSNNRELSFSGDVLPILHSKCLACHASGGEGYEASGFSVLDYESVMAGTKLGAVIIPGSSISSTLYLLVLPTADSFVHMPRQKSSHTVGLVNHLQQDEIDLIARWIDEGAKNN